MIRVLPIDFLGQGAMLTPADPRLHDLAVDYCNRELAKPVNLSELAKAWVAIEGETVHGVMGYVLKPDVPVIRATNPEALSMMAERLQSYFADMGARGKEVLIYLAKAEMPAQRCAGWRNVLISEQQAKPADRFVVMVR